MRNSPGTYGELDNGLEHLMSSDEEDTRPLSDVQQGRDFVEQPTEIHVAMIEDSQELKNDGSDMVDDTSKYLCHCDEDDNIGSYDDDDDGSCTCSEDCSSAEEDVLEDRESAHPALKPARTKDVLVVVRDGGTDTKVLMSAKELRRLYHIEEEPDIVDV